MSEATSLVLRLSSRHFFFWNHVCKKCSKSHERSSLVFSVMLKKKKKQLSNIRSLKQDFGLWQEESWFPLSSWKALFKTPKKVLLCVTWPKVLKIMQHFFPMVTCFCYWHIDKMLGLLKCTVPVCLPGNTVVSALFLSPGTIEMCSEQLGSTCRTSWTQS